MMEAMPFLWKDDWAKLSSSMPAWRLTEQRRTPRPEGGKPGGSRDIDPKAK